MDYLLYKLIWYVLIALIIGGVVGWMSCSRAED